jgi:ATP-binding cassette subfamily F protein 3
VNFLVLDEPTNHLDLWARDALEQALRAFTGTMLCVSHDRFFLNQVVDHLIVLQPEHHQVVPGNFDDYLRGKLPAAAARAPSGTNQAKHQPAPDATHSSGRTNSQPSRGTPRKKRRFPYRKVADLEAEIFQKEEEVAALHERLLQPEVLRQADQIKQIQQRTATLQAELKQLYEHWEEANELN